MKRTIVFVYNSFSDPLFQSNLYQYILKYQKSYPGKVRFTVISFEQAEFGLNADERSKIHTDLKMLNIEWIPLKWHTGQPKILIKAFDLLISVLTVAKLRLRGYRQVVSLGTVAGAFSQLISEIFRLKHFNYQYEPHGEFLRDFGLIGSLPFKILNFLEDRIGKKAEVIATGTNHMLDRLHTRNRTENLFLVPSCVDERRFVFSAQAREEIRAKLSLSPDQYVFVYAGKLGGIYYDEELLDLFSVFAEKIERSYFLILTGQPIAPLEERMIQKGIDRNLFCILKAHFSEMPNYLSAADFGLVSVPPLPSQKFRSPIKVGEYLCCGLPYLVCEGVSEDDHYAQEYQVGVVVNNFDVDSLERSIPEIQNFLKEKKERLRERCRKIGISYRGFDSLSVTMNQAFERLHQG